MASIPSGRHASAAIGPPAAAEIAAAFEQFCVQEGVPDGTAWRARVALDEIIANIVSHGGPVPPGGVIDVWFRRDEDTLEIRIADDGAPFDLLQRPAPDLGARLEDRQPGGLGIMLVRALMDEVRYERTSRNVLTLRKRLEFEPTGRP